MVPLLPCQKFTERDFSMDSELLDLTPFGSSGEASLA